MKIIVVGNGKIGKSIVSQLGEEGHEVVVIDNDEGRVSELGDIHDVMALHGNGALRQVQLEAGVGDADMLIAVTGGDELNLLCCLVAKKLGAKCTIARVRNPDYLDQFSLIREDLGLSMVINPEFNAAQDIFSVLRFPGVLNVEKFAKGRVEIAEFRLPADSPIESSSLIEISRKYKIKYLICAVRRQKQTIIPDGSFVLKADDRISFVAAPAESERFLRAAGIPARAPKKTIIVGAGIITHYLTRMLGTVGVHPTVIDNNLERCQRFGEAFPNCLVLHGDGSNRELLAEERLDHADAFVAATGTDEVNILLAMYATSQNVPKVVTKLSHNMTVDLVSEEKLGSIVSPNEVTSDQVISYVRAMANSGASNVESLYTLVDNTVEALEFVVRERDERLLDIPLKTMKLKKELLISCIIRQGRVLLPNGDDCIRLGDRLIVVTTTTKLGDLRSILA